MMTPFYLNRPETDENDDDKLLINLLSFNCKLEQVNYLSVHDELLGKKRLAQLQANHGSNCLIKNRLDLQRSIFLT
jgi:hypothetical protein